MMAMELSTMFFAGGKKPYIPGQEEKVSFSLREVDFASEPREIEKNIRLVSTSYVGDCSCAAIDNGNLLHWAGRVRGTRNTGLYYLEADRPGVACILNGGGVNKKKFKVKGRGK